MIRAVLLESMTVILLLGSLGCILPPCRPESNGECCPERVANNERQTSTVPSAESLPVPRRAEEDSDAFCPPELLDEREGQSGEGLTLDACTERLLVSNSDLAARFQDIPKARADVLTAGLRNDPVLFLSASPIPYARFSPQRPGATAYDVTIVQALDLNGKHKANQRVAQKLVPVLEARYQDAVRRKIDALYTLYVNVLEARAALHISDATGNRLSIAVQITRDPRGQRPPSQLEQSRALVRCASARATRHRIETTLAHARRELGTLLELPFDQADCLQVWGTLHDRFPSPPCTEELIQLALRTRPDLLAHRLSVDRADAEIRRARAESLEDFFLFYSPYQGTDLSPQNKQSTTSWEIGLLLPIPAFNRNQGEIARARVNAVQRRVEVEQKEQEVADEVRRAATEYAASRDIVRQYEHEVLPGARELRDEKYRQFIDGTKDVGVFLSAQKDYDEILHHYLEELVRHRRSMLWLNTAVGQRLLP